MRLAALLTALLYVVPLAARPSMDAHDRAAVIAWFVLLADAQFYRPTSDVTDCSGLVRHALREAWRPHTAEWQRRIAIPGGHTRPDLRRPLVASGDGLPLFRIADRPPRYAEFADARTIVEYNAALVGRDGAAARPGDLLVFHQAGQRLPAHLMVFIGRSVYEPEHADWVVYHTGPDGTTGDSGEMRKATLADLRRHPAPRWRPVPENPAFVGVHRLRFP